jgi:hypothetical protein
VPPPDTSAADCLCYFHVTSLRITIYALYHVDASAAHIYHPLLHIPRIAAPFVASHRTATYIGGVDGAITPDSGDSFEGNNPHIAVDMVALQMQAALAVVRCQPVEPYTALTDEPSVLALAEVEQLRATLLAKRHALYADNLPNAIADA